MMRYLLPLLLLTNPLAADTIKQQQGPATLELQFPGEGKRLALADLVTVTLTVEGHTSLRVRAPDDLGLAAPWQVIERSTPTRTPIGTERVRWQLRYQFAPREPGIKVPFAFPDVVLREKEDDDQTIKFTPNDIEVFTSIPPNDPGELRDITAIEELPSVSTTELAWQWLAAIAGVVSLIALVVVIRLLLKRRRLRSNAQIALYEWQRLIALRLPEQDKSERFVTLLSVIVRRYLERQFSITARRQTTEELQQQVAQHPALSNEEKQFLADFLQSCDAVKYANQAMTSEECRRWAGLVEQFLRRRLQTR